MSMDEWTESKNALSLVKDIHDHLDGFLVPLDTDERESLVRCIMISVRQWDEQFCKSKEGK